MRYLAAFISLAVAAALWTGCSTPGRGRPSAVGSPASGVAPSPTPSGMNPERIDVYVTPYYATKGPMVQVGRYSGGLRSNDPKKFLATIGKMRARWLQLTFLELYVGAIRLYNLGYRDDAVYWFYTAQYRGRQFTGFLNPSKIGGIGSPAFELQAANGAFMETAGPWINGYAFRDPDRLVATIRRVQSEGRATIPDLRRIYPAVAFIDPRQWPAVNAKLAGKMDSLVAFISQHKDEIKQQRIANGSESTFSRVSNKELPKRRG